MTDRLGGVSSRPYDALNLGDHVGDDPAAVAENRRRLAAGLGLAPGRLAFMQQVHGDDGGRRRRLGATAQPARPRPTRWSPPSRGSAWSCWSPTACRCCSRRRGRTARCSAAAHAGRQGCRPAWWPRPSRRCAGSAPGSTEGQAHVGPGGLRALLRGAGRAAGRGRRRRAGRGRCTTRDGYARAGPAGARVLAQLVAAGVRDLGPTRDLHRRDGRPLLAPPRRRHRPVRRGRLGAGVSADPSGRRRGRRRAEIAASLAAGRGAHRRGLRGGRPRPGRRDPGRGHQDLPGRRRRPPGRPRGPRRGGEPRPGGGRQGRRLPRTPGSTAWSGTSSASCRRNKARVGRGVRRRRALRRPACGWSRALDRAAGGGRAPLDALVQVDLDDEPRDAAGRRGARPTSPALADAVAAAEHLALGGVMAVAPLGARPGGGLRPARRGRRAAPRRPPGRRRGLRRDERRPRGGRRGTARHTCVSARALLGSRPPLR